MAKKAQGIDRRDFLKTVGVVGVAAGASGAVLTAAGCSSAPSSGGTQTAQGSDGIGKHTWEVAPAPIEDIAETKEFDIVIVGGGMAGNATAEAAARNGASVAVIEQASECQFRGIENGNIGSTWQKEQGIEIDPIEAARMLFMWSQQLANYNLIRTWATQSGRIFDYLQELCAGYGFEVVPSRGPTAKFGWGDYEPLWRVFETGCCFANDEVDVGLMRPDGHELNWNLGEALIKSAQDNGAEYFFENRGERLVGDAESGITGVIASDSSGNYIQYNAKKGVVLACGDIGGNEEMCKCWSPLSLRADGTTYSTINGNLGDGMLMGMWAGAAHSKSPAAHMVHQYTNDNIDFVLTSFHQSWLNVNRNGDRFGAEMPYEPYLTNARCNTPGNVAWSIFDADYEKYIELQHPRDWETRIDGLADALQERIESGYVVASDTIEGLADELGIPADRFAATVERYNSMYDAGEDKDFAVPMQFLSRIQTAPFYAVKSECSELVVPFGLHVDDNSQVCTEDDEPIAGLFAVGNMQGDFFGLSYPVICPGISIGRCWTFGQLVGEALAKDTVFTEIIK